MKKRVLLTAVCAACAFLFAGCGTSKVNVSDAIEISFEGVDGKGEAYLTVDTEKLEDAIKDSGAKDMTRRKRQELMDSVKWELDQSEGLSNGDTVVAVVEWDEDLAEDYNLVLEGSEKKEKVSGLKKLEAVDAFKDIEIVYSGVSPDLSAEVVNHSNVDFLENASYSLSQYDGLEIGETITVTVSYYESEAEEAGYTVLEEEKEYTVEEADAYVTEYAQITDEALEKMKAQAEDLLTTMLSDEYDYQELMEDAVDADYPWDWNGFNSVVNGGMRCTKAFFLLNKDIQNAGYDTTENAVMLTYEVTLSDDVVTTPTPIYIMVQFGPVILRADGTVDVVVTDGFITDGASSVWDNVYRDNVGAQKQWYTVEEIDY